MAENRLFDFPELGDIYSDEDANLIGVIGYSWKEDVPWVHFVRRHWTNEGYTYQTGQMSFRELREYCLPRPGKFEFDFVITMEDSHDKKKTE